MRNISIKTIVSVILLLIIVQLAWIVVSKWTEEKNNTKESLNSMPRFNVLYSEVVEVDNENFETFELFFVYIQAKNRISYLRVAQYISDENNCERNERKTCAIGFWDDWILMSSLERDIKYSIPIAGETLDSMLAIYYSVAERLHVCDLDGC